MYLKALDVNGFKSFADKTRLSFGPGMTAVVGPNGCGKSNISDAVRWVLGEQSAKALRGSKMEDVIFNGTDKRKPLGLAEVSVTFSDCEGCLNTEFNEVTVTRRVFRSGEGQYMINKVPCRLKDIQRLFMDTGVGTTSYSMLEQGRIDAVLSSRPEDRRTIFEEASGITKFKADKKEALRKLEQTEANLLRLSDVIREVKRQIGSLQRQAGKARRYKDIRQRLRSMDIYLTRNRLSEADREIKTINGQLESLTGHSEALQKEIKTLEATAAELHETQVTTEREIGSALENVVQAKSKLTHTREMIDVNRQRIEEYRSLSDRDTREIDRLREQLEQQEEGLERQDAGLKQVTEEEQIAGQALETANGRVARCRDELDATRNEIRRLRDESIELESLLSRLQNELNDIESSERSAVVQRERLAAEKAQLARVKVIYEERQAKMEGELDVLREGAASEAGTLDALRQQRIEREAQLAETSQALAEKENQIAGARARAELLEEKESAGDDYPEGTRRLMTNPDSLGVPSASLLGTVVAQLKIEDDYQRAAEAALRIWSDTLIVRDDASARDILHKLNAAEGGAARLMAATTAAPAPGIQEGDRLIDHIRVTPDLQEAVEHLLGNVLVVPDLDSLPAELAASCTCVTRDGMMRHANGAMEFWMPGEAETPLARRHQLVETQSHIETLEREITQLRTQKEQLRQALVETTASIDAANATLDDHKRDVAQREGEYRVVAREATEARDRFETVSWELENLQTQNAGGADRKQELHEHIREVRSQREQMAATIRERGDAIHQLEQDYSQVQAEATEARVQHSTLRHRLEHLATQRDSARQRMEELRTAAEGRHAGIQSYTDAMQRYAADVTKAEAALTGMEAEVARHQEQAAQLQEGGKAKAAELRRIEQLLAEKRSALEDARDTRSEIETKATESRMRRQNQIERITSDYNIAANQLDDEPEPEWDDGVVPDLDTIETAVAELHTKLDAMGPVNLVAIEEYQELEERHAFLTEQEQDLINSRQQLMDMIRKINRTTSEMFRTTFDQVNENFQTIYAKLFNGGSAKLVLVNEEEVLECGIEIIARPPGKRLQNVSLLSGGERTMTAVALLFAIYMIKPSPFCLLDELDAALDESNIGRFVSVLQSFLGQSQFLIITHNRRTIEAADTLYGITMPERGVSKIVSMKFTNDEAPAEADPALAEVTD